MVIFPPSPTPLRRRLFSAGLLTGAAVLVGGALPSPGATAPAVPQANSLAGQFLVAAPEMGDPRFYHTVILMVQHGEGGALGIVINRPLGLRPLASILEALGDKGTTVSGEIRVFVGGPVEPSAGFIVHSAEYSGRGTINIDGRVAVTSNIEVLRNLGQGRGPRKSLIAFGYAGWRGGQLEGELAQGAWFTEPEDPVMVFDADRETLWDAATKRRTVPL